MNTSEAALSIIASALDHVNEGDLSSSARNCLVDAREVWLKGDDISAMRRGLDSLRYSVGVFHPDYGIAIQKAKNAGFTS